MVGSGRSPHSFRAKSLNHYSALRAGYFLQRMLFAEWHGLASIGKYLELLRPRFSVSASPMMR